jgi:hypothetical protein
MWLVCFNTCLLRQLTCPWTFRCDIRNSARKENIKFFVQINAWTFLTLQHIDKFYALDEPPLMCWCQFSSSIKVSMATRSSICLKENSGRISVPDGVGCKPHLFILSTFICTLWKCLCSSYVHLVHVLTAEESLERDGIGKNSLRWI